MGETKGRALVLSERSRDERSWLCGSGREGICDERNVSGRGRRARRCARVASTGGSTRARVSWEWAAGRHARARAE